MRALKNNVLVKINTKEKEKYALTEKVTIHIERSFNFNLREDRASSGYIIDGGNLAAGTYVLTHYLAIEPGYEVPYQHEFLTEQEITEGYKVFSIPKDMVFAYFKSNEWHPCEGFLLTQRIFKPYTGNLVGIEHEVVKNRLYIVKGVDEWDGGKKDLSGKVCAVTLNSDYEIIWHNKESKEERVIRTMHREIEAIDDGMLKELKMGKYLIGFSPSNCKPLKELPHA